MYKWFIKRSQGSGVESGGGRKLLSYVPATRTQTSSSSVTLCYWERERASGRPHWVSVTSITLLNTLTLRTHVSVTPVLRSETKHKQRRETWSQISLKPQRGLHSTFHPFYSVDISLLVLLAQTLINYRVGGKEKSAWAMVKTKILVWLVQFWMTLKLNPAESYSPRPPLFFPGHMVPINRNSKFTSFCPVQGQI